MIVVIFRLLKTSLQASFNSCADTVKYIGDISSKGNFRTTGDWGPDDCNGTTEDRNAAVGITCLRLWDTGRMGAQRRTQNQLKMYCEQLTKNCSMVYYFSRTI